MVEKVQRYVRKYRMIEENDSIVVGVSGGADSVCLLFVLQELQKYMPFSLYVVHVNHKIREEAGEDADYVKQICENCKLPYFLVEEDVEALAKKEHLSSEEAGRKVRYEAFAKVCTEQKANKIAVAHNKNDRAETVLFNLFRGSSIKGLNGIAPVREQIIRPLLCVERSEIEAYLQENQIPYCTDRTNAEDTYTRNKIRNRVLPYVSEQICENVITHISDTAEVLEEAEAFLQKMTQMSYGKLVTEERELEIETNVEMELQIDIEGFLELDTILQKYLIMTCLHKVAGSRKDITSTHVQKVIELFSKPVNKKVNLPYHMIAKKNYQTVTICSLTDIKDVKIEIRKEMQNDNLQGEAEQNYLISANQSLWIKGLGRIETRLFPYEKTKTIPEKTYTKWFDYDKIDKSMLLRHRQTGDYLMINEQNNTKTLKEYMIHVKIPQADRNQLYVLAVDNHIVWLIGYRISQYYKVDQNTKNILEVHIVGGNDNGRTC